MYKFPLFLLLFPLDRRDGRVENRLGLGWARSVSGSYAVHYGSHSHSGSHLLRTAWSVGGRPGTFAGEAGILKVESDDSAMT